ncbi:hypothetical protein Hdeb2414_s0005g00183531 [Helianthus debilis subsp. tardiflorus]
MFHDLIMPSTQPDQPRNGFPRVQQEGHLDKIHTSNSHAPLNPLVDILLMSTTGLELSSTYGQHVTTLLIITGLQALWNMCCRCFLFF